MCLYTQTLHACGHPLYTLKVSCSKYFHNPLTNAPACALTPTERPPKLHIAETVVYAFLACGQDSCTYTVDSDPFLDPGVQVGVFPRAPSLGASVWNVLPAGQRKQKDIEMEGTHEVDGRGFAAPVDTASFYARPKKRKTEMASGRSPLALPSPVRQTGHGKRRKVKGERAGREAGKRGNEVNKGTAKRRL